MVSLVQKNEEWGKVTKRRKKNSRNVGSSVKWNEDISNFDIKTLKLVWCFFFFFKFSWTIWFLTYLFFFLKIKKNNQKEIELWYLLFRLNGWAITILHKNNLKASKHFSHIEKSFFLKPRAAQSTIATAAKQIYGYILYFMYMLYDYDSVKSQHHPIPMVLVVLTTAITLLQSHLYQLTKAWVRICQRMKKKQL